MTVMVIVKQTIRMFERKLVAAGEVAKKSLVCCIFFVNLIPIADTFDIAFHYQPHRLSCKYMKRICQYSFSSSMQDPQADLK